MERKYSLQMKNVPASSGAKGQCENDSQPLKAQLHALELEVQKLRNERGTALRIIAKKHFDVPRKVSSQLASDESADPSVCQQSATVFSAELARKLHDCALLEHSENEHLRYRISELQNAIASCYKSRTYDQEAFASVFASYSTVNYVVPGYCDYLDVYGQLNGKLALYQARDEIRGLKASKTELEKEISALRHELEYWRIYCSTRMRQAADSGFGLQTDHQHTANNLVGHYATNVELNDESRIGSSDSSCKIEATLSYTIGYRNPIYETRQDVETTADALLPAENSYKMHIEHINACYEQIAQQKELIDDLNAYLYESRRQNAEMRAVIASRPAYVVSEQNLVIEQLKMAIRSKDDQINRLMLISRARY